MTIDFFDKAVTAAITVIITVVGWAVKVLITNKEQVQIVKQSIENQSKSIDELKSEIESLRREFKEDMKSMKEDLVLIIKMNRSNS